MKYIGTYCYVSHPIDDIVNKKTGNLPNYHSQFRIVCKARGINHANELTQLISRNVFHREFSCETANEHELSFFEKDSNVIFIIGQNHRYITDIELKKLLTEQ